MTLSDDKIEIQKQWDTDPCGADTVVGVDRETREYYREIRRYRYEQYAPWFDEVMRFSEWSGKDVLEIGVGLGSDHYRFAQGGARLTALDLSREHLRHTVRHLALEGFKTRDIYGDAEDSQLPDESFDLVYSFGVLHHTPNTEKAIAEVHRILRPGGTALIGLYHRNSAFYWVHMIFARGILLGGLLLKGKRRLLSEIEYRRDGNDAIPLVKVYTKEQVAELFKDFSACEITVCHIEAAHLATRYFSWLLRWLPRATIERRLGRWGWYVVARVRK